MYGKHGQGDGINGLIGRLYDAALDPGLWSDVGQDIGRLLEAHSVGLFVQDTRQDPQWLVHTSNLTANVHEYNAHYRNLDVWAERGSRKALSQVVTSQELISDADFMRTEFCNGFCRKAGLFRMIGTVFEVSGGAVSVLGVHRPEGMEAFSQDDKALLDYILPHLTRALQVRKRLVTADIAQRAALDALERTGVAIVVVERDGRVLYATSEAEALLREGGVIHATSGRLTASSPAVAGRLAEAIQRSADTSSGRDMSITGVMKLDRAGRLPITVLSAPFRPAQAGFGAPVPAAILFIRDPERDSPSRRALQSLFGLTATEASVAGMLAEGMSVESIAAAHRIKLSTVRTHLKGIFAKTGTSRQVELVVLILQSVAATLGSGRNR